MRRVNKLIKKVINLFYTYYLKKILKIIKNAKFYRIIINKSFDKNFFYKLILYKIKKVFSIIK